jgi:hypothetical protein
MNGFESGGVAGGANEDLRRPRHAVERDVVGLLFRIDGAQPLFGQSEREIENALDLRLSLKTPSVFVRVRHRLPPPGEN